MPHTESDLDGVFTRATVDALFRSGLQTDPVGTLKAGGYDTSGLPRITFVERPADAAALIVLPDYNPAGTLSIEELESVAGGVAADCVILSNCKCSLSVFAP